MVACIDFFEMSEICRPKFIVRHSTSFCKEKSYNFENCVSKEELAIILKDGGFNMRKNIDKIKIL
jgi:hypothetical protein